MNNTGHHFLAFEQTVAHHHNPVPIQESFTPAKFTDSPTAASEIVNWATGSSSCIQRVCP